MKTTRIMEKIHRLPRDHYKGIVTVSFTLCIKDRNPVFTDQNIVETFVDILEVVVHTSQCTVPVYCFMPDHLHLILHGLNSETDLWRSIVQYKQKTGFWMSKNRPEISWQKDFYDHIIRTNESLATQVRYLLDNPVRKGIVSSWEEFRFKGSIGYDLRDVLEGIC